MTEPVKLVMRRPTLDGLARTPGPPDGYELVAATTGDAPGLARLLTAAFDLEWSEPRVRELLLDDPDVDTTWIVTHRGAPVATASAQVPADLPVGGRLHWVGADPAHRRRRLGRTVSLAVLHRLRELGRTEAELRTDPPRLAAIRLYLTLGFVPDVRDATHAAVWDAVRAAL